MNGICIYESTHSLWILIIDLSEIWDEDLADSDDCIVNEGDDRQEEPHAGPALPLDTNDHCEVNHTSSLASWFTSFIILLQARHYIPDRAIDLLLKFLHAFFVVLGCLSNATVAVLAKALPRSVHLLREQFRRHLDFKKYVVCRKCNSLYRFEDCLTTVGSHVIPQKCTFIEYPHHPQYSFRQQCGTHLLKTVELSSGKKIFYPLKVYCYNSLKKQIQELFLRPNFADNCELWRSRRTPSDLHDVYDGRLWKDFLHFRGKPFLADPFNLAVMFNVDWFQPYKLTVSSVGVMYLTVINLPRALRFKRENVIIVGIIPGPSEPQRHMNTFLRPLVDELLQPWEGVLMKIPRFTTPKLVRCALLCVACDMPAGRKACGFLAHSATLGCTKCLKKFVGTVVSKDYSGFDRSGWIKRTGSSHRSSAQQSTKARTASEKAKLESSVGCRYSELLKLPYFDAPRMLVVDPMHNLYLGTAKRMVKLWMEFQLLKQSQLVGIQEKIDTMLTPVHTGRIPRKVQTGFSGFTADQFKNWVNIYSIPCLRELFKDDDLECWRHFVLASRILCKKVLSDSDITVADALLLQFCRKVEQLYGRETITPNMHMHCHLREVLQDYGPVYGFWLFSFERYNGILGHQPSSNRCIESQLMRCFLQDQIAFVPDYPEKFSNEFKHFFTKAERLSGSTLQTMALDSTYTLPSKAQRKVHDKDVTNDIKLLVCRMDTTSSLSVHTVIVNSTYLKYSSLTNGDITYTSKAARQLSSSTVFARWESNLYGPRPTYSAEAESVFTDFSVRPVQILYYAKVSYSTEGSEDTRSDLFAVVQWYKPHPSMNHFGKPVQVWFCDLFECSGPQSFVPICNLVCSCASAVYCVCGQSVLVVVPSVH